MVKVTEEMRAAAAALMNGRCPKCDELLNVGGDAVENGELFWLCSKCHYSTNGDTIYCKSSTGEK